MAGLLTGYLRQAAARRFGYGTFDCGLLLADWIAVRRGVDPAAQWRGRYCQLDQVQSRRGGLVRLFTDLARCAGLVPTRHPAVGDVALVSIAGAPVVGAIRVVRGFVVIAAGGGLSCAPAVRLARAWSV